MELSIKGLDYLATFAILLGASAFVLGFVLMFPLGLEVLFLTMSIAVPLLLIGIALKVTVIALHLYSKHVAAYTRIAAVLDRNLDIWARNTK